MLCLAGVLAVPVASPELRPPVASPDLRPPRGLPAREPLAPRASLGASARSPARPCRPRGGLQSGEPWCCEWPGLAWPPTGAVARPSGPSGALHTSGAGDAGVWLARCPDAQLWLSISNFARNSLMTHSNTEFASLELQCFWGMSKNDRDKLRAKFGWWWCRYRPLRPSAP